MYLIVSWSVCRRCQNETIQTVSLTHQSESVGGANAGPVQPTALEWSWFLGNMEDLNELLRVLVRHLRLSRECRFRRCWGTEQSAHAAGVNWGLREGGLFLITYFWSAWMLPGQTSCPLHPRDPLSSFSFSHFLPFFFLLICPGARAESSCSRPLSAPQTK